MIDESSALELAGLALKALEELAGLALAICFVTIAGDALGIPADLAMSEAFASRKDFFESRICVADAPAAPKAQPHAAHEITYVK